MSSETSSGDERPGQSHKDASAQRPDWADGLRQLYDSVVDEPLPDTFKDLLARLDDNGSNNGSGAANGSDRSHG